MVLLTPGPANTSPFVRATIQKEYGSREPAFRDVIKKVRTSLLEVVASENIQEYECILMNGNATLAIESVLYTLKCDCTGVVSLCNGAYGSRIGSIATDLGLPVCLLNAPDTDDYNLDELERKLAADESLSHVTVVHCETSSGYLNDVRSIAQIVKKYSRHLVVDAVSTFGGIPIDASIWDADFIVASSNKCLHGIPGVGIIIAKRQALLRCCTTRGASLNLFAQWRSLEDSGLFRYTAPTHAMVALLAAIQELSAQGGPSQRYLNYCTYRDIIRKGLASLGFSPIIDDPSKSPILTAFKLPKGCNYEVDTLFSLLYEQGYVIYHGMSKHFESFRVSHIGAINETIVKGFVEQVSLTINSL